VYTRDFWAYDPVADAWSKKVFFRGGERSGAVGFSIGNKGYIGAGDAGYEISNDFWEYDSAIALPTLTVIKVGHGIVTSVPLGIYCDANCNADFIEGESVVLTAQPDPGSDFTGWYGACSGTGTCGVTMKKDQVIAAIFTKRNSLSVSKSGTGTGTVTSAPPGISCGADCSEVFTEGESVILAAHPDTGFVFTGWSGACSGTGKCVVTMNQDESVEAAFNQVQGTPEMSISPSSINIGTIMKGVTVSKTVTVKNTGTGTLVLGTLALSGANAEEFSSSKTCPGLTENASCTVSLVLVATSFGPKTAFLTIPSNDPRKPTSAVKLWGICEPPKISARPATVNFGTVTVGATSEVKLVTIKNTGASDLVIKSITSNGDTSFAITDNPCGTLGKGSSCTVSLTFGPLTGGSKTSSLTISSNDPSRGTITMKLKGKGK
jgi:hypothetical protein